MNVFRYKALSADGKMREGVQEADSQTALYRSLRRQGWWPVDAVEVRAKDSVPQSIVKTSRMPSKELAAFFHELATLLSSGIVLDRALVILMDREGVPHITQVCRRLLARIRDGRSLAQAVAADSVFPKISVGLVRAGEAAGSLDAELFRLSDIMTKAAAIRSEIISALVYPIILLLTAGLVIGVIMVVVVPEFVPLFDDSGRTPPLAFRFLMAASDVITHWGWVFLAVTFLIYLVIRRLLKSTGIRRSWDKASLNIPLYGPIQREIEVGRFCRTLGSLMKADVTLPTGVGLAADTVGNSAMSAALAGVAKTLREGSRLVDRIVATGQFSDMVTGLLQVGEESGRLGEMLIRQADISEAKIRTQIARLLAIMVPAITLLLGVIVAGIVTSLLVAILKINDLALK